MLIWVNGTFGVGKTHTVAELHRRLPGSLVIDPEQIGYGLQRLVPAEYRPDFQDFTSWRTGVVEVLDLILHEHDGHVLVPMTVTDLRYFEETVGGLRALGHDVHHVALLADPPTIIRRLAHRGLGGGRLADAVGLRGLALRREAWALERLVPNLERLGHPDFAEHLATDHLTVSQAAEQIAASCGVDLEADGTGRLLRTARRAVTTLQHVRRA
ncbi:AAA family ATPase [Isoptericola croceus]|uniref:AAA family ATPase n=1 Tax=Isoptericola croceus TaxID=3031406 RepID=UPI0023F76498|nr:AAA family ATPase [Isoptericola croceus]